MIITSFEGAVQLNCTQFSHTKQLRSFKLLHKHIILKILTPDILYTTHQTNHRGFELILQLTNLNSKGNQDTH